MIFIVSFMGITILTAVIVLLSNIGVFGETVRTSDFSSKWGVGVVLTEIVGTTIAVVKWSLLPFDVKVYLDFPHKPSIPPDLDIDNCTCEIREAGEIMETCKIGLAIAEGGGWQCSLPSAVKPNHIIKLNLIEKNGQKWEVGPFHPFVSSQTAIMR